MIKKLKRIAWPLTAAAIASASFLGGVANASGSIGAKIYCLMRTSGNPHEASWDAAYESIKRKKEGFFKPSPKHSAAMIIEEVVSDPNKFPGCGKYLGELFGTEQGITTFDEEETQTPPKNNDDSEIKKGERYSY